MTRETLVPFLIVLAAGLVLMLTSPSLGDGDGLSWLDIGGKFREQVDACQAEHPVWDRDVCEGIVRGDLWVGMSTEMVRASLGEPKRIELPDPDDPTREAWTYYTPYYGKEVLQIANGLLTGWGPPADGCDTCGVSRPRPGSD
jgi:hypothetical protein